MTDPWAYLLLFGAGLVAGTLNVIAGGGNGDFVYRDPNAPAWDQWVQRGYITAPKLQEVGGDEEAVELMNDSPFGLTASVWTRDREAALRIGRRGPLRVRALVRVRCPRTGSPCRCRRPRRVVLSLARG